MKKLIQMEMLLIAASILIFRSVWSFLDSMAWANTAMGHAILFSLGAASAWVALKNIHT